MSLLFKYEVEAKNFTSTSRNGKRSATSSSITFDGDTQPINSRDTLALTEGRISSGMIRVFSETPLIVSTEGDSESGKGTYVLFESKWYEVVSEVSWNTKASELESLNHYEYIAEYREKEISS